MFFLGWVRISGFGGSSSFKILQGDMVTRMHHYLQSAVPQQRSDPSCPAFEPRKSSEGQWVTEIR